jgi:signal transduction histidine kinase
MPRRTIRLRLTLLYGGLFLVSGIALLAIMNTLSDTVFAAPTPSRPLAGQLPPPPPRQLPNHLEQKFAEGAVALAITSVVSIGLGWVMAGRILRPLRVMTATTRQISEANLHHRLAVDGPDDELKDLGDTIDGLLARLEAAFDAQKRFVANASHELRTPLTVERAMLEVALADPDATTESLRATCEEVLAAGEHQERLIEGLLTLAHSQQGISYRAPVDLAAVVAAALRRPSDLPISTSLNPATVSGDPRLIERLVTNLLDNAQHHNIPGGHILVTTSTIPGRAVFSIANTGPDIPENEIQRLLQPFQRMATDRTGERSGLGLSIVAAIARAHNAMLDARPGPGGGLTVNVIFPVRPNHSTVD